jgi:acyl-CoA thioester hydrolase
MGHMNVMWYTGKFDEATWTFFAFLGVPPTSIRKRKPAFAACNRNLLQGDANDPSTLNNQLEDVTFNSGQSR